jgi:hypothetical protein
VQHPDPVCGAQRRQYPEPYVCRAGRRHRAVSGDDLIQGPRRQVLHDDPGSTVGDDDVVHANNIGVVKPGGSARLTQRPREHLFQVGCGETLRRHHLLDGHGAVEDIVGREPDPAHASLAERLQKSVAPGDDRARRGHPLTTTRAPVVGN